MFESIKRFGRKMALGAALSSAAVSGEAHATQPMSSESAKTTEATSKKNVEPKTLKASITFEAPTPTSIKEELGSIKFSDQYTEEEQKAILDYLNLRVKIMERLKHFVDIDQSGTDTAKLKIALKGKELHFGMGYNAIKKQLTDPNEKKFIISNESITDDENAINTEAQRMRSSLIQSIKENN